MKPILPCLRLYRPNSNGNEAQGKHGRGKDSQNGGAVREEGRLFLWPPFPDRESLSSQSEARFWGKTTSCLCRGQNASQGALDGVRGGSVLARWFCLWGTNSVRILCRGDVLSHPFRRAWGCVGLPRCGKPSLKTLFLYFSML